MGHLGAVWSHLTPHLGKSRPILGPSSGHLGGAFTRDVQMATWLQHGLFIMGGLNRYPESAIQRFDSKSLPPAQSRAFSIGRDSAIRFRITTPARAHSRAVASQLLLDLLEGHVAESPLLNLPEASRTHMSASENRRTKIGTALFRGSPCKLPGGIPKKDDSGLI